MSSAEFLSRWSRRKREARRDAQRESEPAAERGRSRSGGRSCTAAEAKPDHPGGGRRPSQDRRPDAGHRHHGLSPQGRAGGAEERCAPPHVVARSGDPRLRERSREYAYDWNVPGGVPGNGPLLPTDDVGAMLGRIFGDDDREPETAMPGSPPRVGLSHQREPELPRHPRRRRTQPCAADDAVQHETGSEQAAESAAAHLGRAPLEGAVEADERGRVVHRKKPTSLTPRTRLGRAVMAEPRQFNPSKLPLSLGHSLLL